MCDLFSLDRKSWSYFGVMNSDLVPEIGCRDIEDFHDFPQLFHGNSTSN
jgi:hypothetical protein